MILAGDIGGTNTRLARFDEDFRLVGDIRTFESKAYSTSDGLERVLEEFYRGTRPDARRACVGVAGPILHGPDELTARVTNLPWTVGQKSIARALRIEPRSVGLINDLVANAWGVASLRDSDLHVLNPGVEQAGNRAIISAGTGLGVAGIMWDGKEHRPSPSEGGHSNFGPSTDLEVDFLRFLRERERETFGGHVSWERVLSGPGLVNIFEFLRAREIEIQKLVIPADSTHVASLISRAGIEGTCPRSVRALEQFMSFYGAAAGNVALQFLAVGGLYVGGGIAPRILPKLAGPAFMEAFLDKGPMRERILNKVPVRVITDPNTALRGAAWQALQLPS